jgi:hypothetical protein
MGMFDTIKCELTLPGEPKPRSGAWLQTKDLDNWLNVFTIKADGTLEGPDGPRSFDGVLNFYALEYENPEAKYGDPELWFEYQARFAGGKLVNLECLCVERLPLGVANHARETLYGRASSDDVT